MEILPLQPQYTGQINLKEFATTFMSYISLHKECRPSITCENFIDNITDHIII